MKRLIYPNISFVLREYFDEFNKMIYFNSEYDHRQKEKKKQKNHLKLYNCPEKYFIL